MMPGARAHQTKYPFGDLRHAKQRGSASDKAIILFSKAGILGNHAQGPDGVVYGSHNHGIIPAEVFLDMVLLGKGR
jgi:hypothetical protein